MSFRRPSGSIAAVPRRAHSVTDPAVEPAPAVESSGPPASPRHERRRGWGLWPPVLLLLAAGGAGLWSWQTIKRLEVAERGRDEWQQLGEELRGRIVELDRELDATRERQRALDGRIGDAASGQRVLREEVLGIGERAALLEDAIARLAQSRQEGAQALLLDEAEFLLLLGAERLALFRDPAAAIRAYLLADSALAGLQEPIYAPLRQSLAVELEMLRALPPDPLPGARAAVDALVDALPTLPAPRPAVDPASTSRLARLLGELVTIRRLDEGGVPLDPLTRGARIAALSLQLRGAVAALERGDAEAWQRSVAAFGAAAEGLFDTGDARVQAHLRALAGVSTAAVGLPELGSSLRELRGLRATRRLGTALPDLASPAATTSSTPAPASDADDGDAPEPVEVE